MSWTPDSPSCISIEAPGKLCKQSTTPDPMVPTPDPMIQYL